MLMVSPLVMGQIFSGSGDLPNYMAAQEKLLLL